MALRAAIIGCGSISKNHANSLASGDYAKIVALVDIRPERAESLAAQYAPEAAIYTDWKKMLDEVAPEVVHVCTPHDLHKEMACECLARGINVYLEKPATISDDELCELLAAEKASTAKITVSFQNRRIIPTRLFFSLIEENGGPRAARGMVSWNRGRSYYTADEWHGTLAHEGGGAMINQAIHTLDMLVTAFPAPPVSVQGFSANWENREFSEVEDNASFIVTFEDGGKLSFCATNDYPVDAKNFYEVLTKNGTRITCLEGNVYKNGEKMEIAEDTLPLVGKACWGRGHAVAIREFYEAIVTGGEVPIPLASAARTMQILFALYRSNGERIQLTKL